MGVNRIGTVGTLRARVAELERDAKQYKLVMPRQPFDVRCADALADEVAVLVIRKVIDSRSPAADALLDYRDPPQTERAEYLAERDEREARWCGVAIRWREETAEEIATWLDLRAIEESKDDTVNVTSVLGEAYRTLAGEIRRQAWRKRA